MVPSSITTYNIKKHHFPYNFLVFWLMAPLSHYLAKGLFKYLVIIFRPTPDTPPPPCDQV